MTEMKKQTHNSTAKTLHKWIGMLVSVFLLCFCISGIILNHRELFSPFSVSRNILPSEYRIKNFNNGIIKGTLSLENGKLLAYGNSGIWLTDEDFKNFEDFNEGLPNGIDHRNIRNIVKNKVGTLVCAANFNVYSLDGIRWTKIELPGNSDRIADVTLDKDSINPLILTRSAIYRKTSNGFERTVLTPAEGLPVKFTLFKTLWMLHSGELFGIFGKIVVDAVAIVMIFLSITGILIFSLPFSIRKTIAEKKASRATLLKWNFRWHDKIGYVSVILTILIAFTGMCLRPPLMIPAVLIKTSPMPGSSLDSTNPWHDRLRGIRWDDSHNGWLISTSEGFIRVNETLSESPKLLNPKTTPPLSPMGINVFEKNEDDRWIVGSFSGMYLWNPESGDVEDIFTHKPHAARQGRPISAHLISGYSKDLKGRQTFFDYDSGWSESSETPEPLRNQPMSLWNFALELHVGRCYTPLIGPLSSLFIFLSGLLLLTVLVTGLILHNRMRRGRTSHASLSNNDNNINQ